MDRVAHIAAELYETDHDSSYEAALMPDTRYADQELMSCMTHGAAAADSHPIRPPSYLPKFMVALVSSCDERQVYTARHNLPTERVLTSHQALQTALQLAGLLLLTPATWHLNT